MHVLKHYRDPLTFWCYAFVFVVDYLNQSLKKPFGWKTFVEIMNEDTDDISEFCYRF